MGIEGGEEMEVGNEGGGMKEVGNEGGGGEGLQLF